MSPFSGVKKGVSIMKHPLAYFFWFFFFPSSFAPSLGKIQIVQQNTEFYYKKKKLSLISLYVKFLLT